MALTTRTIHAQDVDIVVTESDGRGMPVLMIHGSGSSRQIFQNQFDSALSDRYHIH